MLATASSQCTRCIHSLLLPRVCRCYHLEFPATTACLSCRKASTYSLPSQTSAIPMWRGREKAATMSESSVPVLSVLLLWA
jgi:hypothetical protein